MPVLSTLTPAEWVGLHPPPFASAVVIIIILVDDGGGPPYESCVDLAEGLGARRVQTARVLRTGQIDNNHQGHKRRKGGRGKEVGVRPHEGGGEGAVARSLSSGLVITARPGHEGVM
jgi:hypothetical protein